MRRGSCSTFNWLLGLPGETADEAVTLRTADCFRCDVDTGTGDGRAEKNNLAGGKASRVDEQKELEAESG